MSLILDRIDSVPLAADKLSPELSSWLTVLADSLNTIIQSIENVLVPSVFLSSHDPIVAQINNYYIIGNATQTTVTAPNTAARGSILGVIGLGAGGWILQPGSGQTIIDVTSSGTQTASASITSAEQYDNLIMMCIVANTTWVTLSTKTTGFAYI